MEHERNHEERFPGDSSAEYLSQSSGEVTGRTDVPSGPTRIRPGETVEGGTRPEGTVGHWELLKQPNRRRVVPPAIAQPVADASDAPRCTDAAPDRAEVPKVPEVPAESDTRSERHERALLNETPSRVRVKELTRLIKDDEAQEDHSEDTLPDVGAIMDMLKSGEDVALEVSRKVAGGPLSFRVTNGAEAKNAVVDADSERIEAGPEDSEAPEPQNVPQVWTRIKPTFHGADEGSEDEGPTAKGLDFGALANRVEGPFTLVVRGVKAPEQKLREATAVTKIDLSNVQGGRASQLEKPRLEATLDRLEVAKNMVPVELDVVVGTQNESDLRRVASVAASRVLPNSEALTWSEEKVDGKVMPYRSEQEAFAAPRHSEKGRKYDYLVDPSTLAELLQMPREAVEGLPYRDVARFALDIYRDPSKPSVRLGEIVDENGRSHGSFEVPIEVLSKPWWILGRAGMGKTEILRELTVQAVKHYNRLAEAGELPRGRMPVWLETDYAKRNNLAEPIKQRLAAEGVEVPVYPVEFGGDGPSVGINLFRPIGEQTPNDLITELCDEFSGMISGDEARQLFGKYFVQMVKNVYLKHKWDLSMSPADYKNAGLPVPSSPEARELPHVIEEVFAMSRQQAGTQGDVQQFMDATTEAKLLGAIGLLIKAAHDLDIEKMLNLPEGGVVAMDLHRLREQGLQDLALRAIYRRMLAVLQERYPNGDVPTPDVFWWNEEIGTLFNKGNDNAIMAAQARGIGAGLGFSSQTNASEMNELITGNLEMKIMFNLPLKSDRVAVGGGLSESERKLDTLAQIPPGHALINIPGVTRYGSVMVKFDHPDDPVLRPKDESAELASLEPIVDMDNALELYTGNVVGQAIEFMRTNEVGRKVHAWARNNVILAALNHRPLDINPEGDLYKQLRLLDETDPAKLHAAVSYAVKKLADARGLDSGRKQRVTNYMVEQIRSGTPDYDESWWDLGSKYARYAPVLDKLMEEKLAPTLDTSTMEPYVKVCGFIGGATADQQLDAASVIAENDIEEVRKVIAGESSGPDEVYKARFALARLTGGSDPNAVDDWFQDEFQRLYGRGITEREKLGFDQLTSTLQPDWIAAEQDQQRRQQLTNALTHGLPVLNDVLARHIRNYEAKHTGPINLTTEEQIYEESFMKNEKGVPFETLDEQIAHVEALEKRHEDDTETKLDIEDLIHGPDLIFGGNDSDRMLDPKKMSNIHRRQRADYGVRDGDQTLLRSIRRGDSRAKVWSAAYSNLLYGDGKNADFIPSASAYRALVNGHINTIDKIAARETALRAEHGAAKGEKAATGASNTAAQQPATDQNQQKTDPAPPSVKQAVVNALGRQGIEVVTTDVSGNPIIIARDDPSQQVDPAAVANMMAVTKAVLAEVDKLDPEVVYGPVLPAVADQTPQGTVEVPVSQGEVVKFGIQSLAGYIQNKLNTPGIEATQNHALDDLSVNEEDD